MTSGILVIIIGGILSILSFFEKFKKNDKVSYVNIFKVIGSLLIVGLGIYVNKTQSETAETNQKALVDNTIHARDTVVQKISEGKDTVIKNATINTDTILKSQKRSKDLIYSLEKKLAAKEKPRLEFIPTPDLKNPVIEYLENHLYLEATLSNSGAYAHKFVYYACLLVIQRDTLLTKGKIHIEDESLYIANNDKDYTFRDPISGTFNDSTFIYLTVKYSDEKNENYPPMHWVFKYPGALNQSFLRSTNEEYNLVKRILMRKKFWNR